MFVCKLIKRWKQCFLHIPFFMLRIPVIEVGVHHTNIWKFGSSFSTSYKCFRVSIMNTKLEDKIWSIWSWWARKWLMLLKTNCIVRGVPVFSYRKNWTCRTSERRFNASVIIIQSTANFSLDYDMVSIVSIQNNLIYFFKTENATRLSY